MLENSEVLESRSIELKSRLIEFWPMLIDWILTDVDRSNLIRSINFSQNWLLQKPARTPNQELLHDKNSSPSDFRSRTRWFPDLGCPLWFILWMDTMDDLISNGFSLWFIFEWIHLMVLRFMVKKLEWHPKLNVLWVFKWKPRVWVVGFCLVNSLALVPFYIFHFFLFNLAFLVHV
jgi:hypothetical protein